MDDLIAFLRARLDERVRVAPDLHDAECGKLELNKVYYQQTDNEPCDCGEPERELADIESKRRIIADCERAIARAKASKHGDDYERWPPWSKLAYRTVWNLAQPFAGHPDYRESPFAASVIAFMTWLESESGSRDTP